MLMIPEAWQNDKLMAQVWAQPARDRPPVGRTLPPAWPGMQLAASKRGAFGIPEARRLAPQLSPPVAMPPRLRPSPHPRTCTQTLASSL